jgi:hypothetical protein
LTYKEIFMIQLVILLTVERHLERGMFVGLVVLQR